MLVAAQLMLIIILPSLLSLPRPFDFYYFEIADRIPRKKCFDEFLFDCLYHFNDSDDDGHVKYLAKILFASLYHHHKYLAGNLYPQSLLINSTFFCNLQDHIMSCVKIVYPWDNTRKTLQFNGVPP